MAAAGIAIVVVLVVLLLILFAAVKIAREISYDNAGTIEFLYDLDRNDWFFIEMNPRIQVEPL